MVEQLNRDAGYELVYADPLENAAAQENFASALMYGISQEERAHCCIGLHLLINSESTTEEGIH